MGAARQTHAARSASVVYGASVCQVKRSRNMNHEATKSRSGSRTSSTASCLRAFVVQSVHAVQSMLGRHSDTPKLPIISHLKKRSQPDVPAGPRVMDLGAIEGGKFMLLLVSQPPKQRLDHLVDHRAIDHP